MENRRFAALRQDKTGRAHGSLSNSLDSSPDRNACAGSTRCQARHGAIQPFLTIHDAPLLSRSLTLAASPLFLIITVVEKARLLVVASPCFFSSSVFHHPPPLIPIRTHVRPAWWPTAIRDTTVIRSLGQGTSASIDTCYSFKQLRTETSRLVHPSRDTVEAYHGDGLATSIRKVIAHTLARSISTSRTTHHVQICKSSKTKSQSKHERRALTDCRLLRLPHRANPSSTSKSSTRLVCAETGSASSPVSRASRSLGRSSSASFPSTMLTDQVSCSRSKLLPNVTRD